MVSLGILGFPAKARRRRLAQYALLIMEDVGLSNDQDLTTSTARAWQPLKNKKESAQMTLLRQSLTMRQNTRAVCSTKLNSVLPEISLVPFAVCNVFLLQLSEKQS